MSKSRVYKLNLGQTRPMLSLLVKTDPVLSVHCAFLIWWRHPASYLTHTFIQLNKTLFLHKLTRAKLNPKSTLFHSSIVPSLFNNTIVHPTCSFIWLDSYVYSTQLNLIFIPTYLDQIKYKTDLILLAYYAFPIWYPCLVCHSSIHSALPTRPFNSAKLYFHKNLLGPNSFHVKPVTELNLR